MHGLSVRIFHTDICIPVTEPAVLNRLFFGKNKMRKPEHGSHIFFAAVIMARNPQNIAYPFARLIAYTGKYQIPVIIIAMKQKAVVSIRPVFPR